MSVPGASCRADPFGFVGALLASRYLVEALVEETASSVVYRAVHRVWKRPVAIKAFKAPAADGAAQRELLDAFVREGALLADLSERTAAVCQARDVASVTTADGRWVPYMVLEWLEGEPLDLLLARERSAGGRPRRAGDALRMLAPIARALSVAHELGVVHRDVKPANIFVLADESGRAMGPTKLLDFGIAAVGSQDPVSLVDSFTPGYGAPEQFSSRHGAVGPWTDVFALALVFVELLTGHEALRGETIDELAACACDLARRPTPSSFGVEVPAAVERVLAQALAVSPADRFENAAELWEQLKRAATAARRRTIAHRAA